LTEQHTLFEPLEKVEPEIFSKSLREWLTNSFLKYGLRPKSALSESLVPFLAANTIPLLLIEEVNRIHESTIFSEEKKQNLLLRAFLRRLPDDMRKPILSDFFPQLNASDVNEALQSARTLRKGYLSGVFNPIHSGHPIKEAIESAVLDELIVIPTPATSHNEVPIEWKHRLEMAKLATKAIPGVKVIGEEYEALLQQGTGKAIEKLQQESKDTHWTHVMGSDSFPRSIEKGFLEVSSSNEILVMERQGVEAPAMPKNQRIPIRLLQLPGKETQIERSSTFIRKHLAQGKPITELKGIVTPEVAEYINSNQLYLDWTTAAGRTGN